MPGQVREREDRALAALLRRQVEGAAQEARVAWRLELPAGAWADGPVEGTADGTTTVTIRAQ